MDGFGMSDPNAEMEVSFGNATAADHVMMNSILASGISPSMHETQTMLDFNNAFGGRMPNFPMLEKLEFGMELTDIDSDDSTAAASEQPQHGSRKRLSMHQVHCLEKSFRVDSKLEPRRKSELAKELGLKPRQVAIWFQNRRARQKNKQIEKDYDKVAGQYGMIKAQYDKVISENKKLKAQVKSMKKEMSLMEDSLRNYGKLMKAGLLDIQMLQTQPQMMSAQAKPQLIQQTRTELQQAYNNPEKFNSVSNEVQQQQKVISPASSVFDSNSPMVTSYSKPLASEDVYYPVVEPVEKRSTKFMQGEQEKSVNQELSYDLPNLFDLDERNCFYSSQVDILPHSPSDFGIIPVAEDPFWHFGM